jgi:hypothetical protein
MTWGNSMNSTKRVRPEDLQVDQTAKPDWVSGTDLPPIVGDRVHCTGGLADVVKILGKASDGTRILELKLVDIIAPPFFAAASNVLVAPR